MAFKYSFAKQYNRSRLFDINVEGLEYRNLVDIFDNEDTIWVVEALYISDKSKHGDHPCAVVHNMEGNFRTYVNLPQHMTKMANDILLDDNAIAAINAGMVGFTIYTYETDKCNETCYSIRWVDLG